MNILDNAFWKYFVLSDVPPHIHTNIYTHTNAYIYIYIYIYIYNTMKKGLLPGFPLQDLLGFSGKLLFLT